MKKVLSLLFVFCLFLFVAVKSEAQNENNSKNDVMSWGSNCCNDEEIATDQDCCEKAGGGTFYSGVCCQGSKVLVVGSYLSDADGYSSDEEKKCCESVGGVDFTDPKTGKHDCCRKWGTYSDRGDGKYNINGEYSEECCSKADGFTVNDSLGNKICCDQGGLYGKTIDGDKNLACCRIHTDPEAYRLCVCGAVSYTDDALLNSKECCLANGGTDYSTSTNGRYCCKGAKVLASEWAGIKGSEVGKEVCCKLAGKRQEYTNVTYKNGICCAKWKNVRNGQCTNK